MARHGQLSDQVVVSDKRGCGGWRFAEDEGVTVLYYNPRDAASPSAEQVVDTLQGAGVQYIVLAGYLKAGAHSCLAWLGKSSATALILK